MTAMEQMGARAKEAARKLAVAGSQKDVALEAIAQALIRHCDKILEANRIDLEQGEKNGLTASPVSYTHLLLVLSVLLLIMENVGKNTKEIP